MYRQEPDSALLMQLFQEGLDLHAQIPVLIKEIGLGDMSFSSQSVLASDILPVEQCNQVWHTLM